MPEKTCHDGMEGAEEIIDQLQAEFLRKLDEFANKAKQGLLRGGPSGEEAYQKAISFLSQQVPSAANGFTMGPGAPPNGTS